MTKKAEKKEHKEHEKALKPLLKHLKSDEKKIAKMKRKQYASENYGKGR